MSEPNPNPIKWPIRSELDPAKTANLVTMSVTDAIVVAVINALNTSVATVESICVRIAVTTDISSAAVMEHVTAVERTWTVANTDGHAVNATNGIATNAAM